MNLVFAIAGLAFLILIHEAGHFFTALAVKMRPRRFYIFFPPALVKWKRNGIEYGIGSIPLGGYVKIPGMHKPAAGDLDAHLERASKEAPWLAERAAPVERALEQERLEDARAALPELRAPSSRRRSRSRPSAARSAAITEVDDGLSPEAYWRAPAWKRIAVIAAGPLTNLLFAIAASDGRLHARRSDRGDTHGRGGRPRLARRGGRPPARRSRRLRRGPRKARPRIWPRRSGAAKGSPSPSRSSAAARSRPCRRGRAGTAARTGSASRSASATRATSSRRRSGSRSRPPGT